MNIITKIKNIFKSSYNDNNIQMKPYIFTYKSFKTGYPKELIRFF